MKEKQNPRSIESRLARGIYERPHTLRALELPKVDIRGGDMKLFFKKLRNEISSELGGRYPLLRFGKVEFSKSSDEMYHLKFSHCSPINGVCIKFGEKNKFLIDFKKTKKEFTKDRDWLYQRAGELCEIVEDVLTNRTYI